MLSPNPFLEFCRTKAIPAHHWVGLADDHIDRYTSITMARIAKGRGAGPQDKG